MGQGIALGNSLHLAAVWNENPDILSALIEAGAEVNARNAGGNTPLDETRESGNEPAIQVLLNHQ